MVATVKPWRSAATTRCIAVVDLPVPPFSLATTTTCARGSGAIAVSASGTQQPDGSVVEDRAAARAIGTLRDGAGDERRLRAESRTIRDRFSLDRAADRYLEAYNAVRSGVHL